MEPYKFRNGEAHGEAPRPAPTAPPSAADAPHRPTSRIALAARRARRDPAWGSMTPEQRRRALDLDAADERFLRERGAR